MNQHWFYAADGIVLGLAAGLSPGPLLALVITQSVRFGPREGLKVAFAPLLSDAPAVAIGIAAMSAIARIRPALGAVTFVGAVFVFYLAYDSWRAAAPTEKGQTDAPRSLLRGAFVNMLNPNPYLFWLAVGAPTTVRAWHAHWTAAVAFVGVFYLGLVGAKAAVAVTVGGSKSLLTGNRYVVLMRALAILLALFGCRLIWDGINLVASAR